MPDPWDVVAEAGSSPATPAAPSNDPWEQLAAAEARQSAAPAVDPWEAAAGGDPELEAYRGEASKLAEARGSNDAAGSILGLSPLAVGAAAPGQYREPKRPVIARYDDPRVAAAQAALRTIGIAQPNIEQVMGFLADQGYDFDPVGMQGLTPAPAAAIYMGAGSGMRQGAASLGQGLAGTAAMARVPGAADMAENAANLSREWAGEAAAAGASPTAAAVTSGLVQTAPSLAAAPFGAPMAIATSALPAAGQGYTDARLSGQGEGMSYLQGVGQGAMTYLTTRLFGGKYSPEEIAAAVARNPELGQAIRWALSNRVEAAARLRQLAAAAGAEGGKESLEEATQQVGQAGFESLYDPERARQTAAGTPEAALLGFLFGGGMRGAAAAPSIELGRRPAPAPAAPPMATPAPAPAAPPVDPSAITREVDVDTLQREVAAAGAEASGRTVDPRDLEVVRAEEALRQRLLAEHRQMEDQALEGAVISERAQAEAAELEAERARAAAAPPIDLNPPAPPAPPAAPPEEADRFRAATAAARSIEERYQRDLQAIVARRAAGEIGKPQAAAERRAAIAERDRRMAETMQAIADGKPAPAAELEQEVTDASQVVETGVQPALGPRPVDRAERPQPAPAAGPQPVPAADRAVVPAPRDAAQPRPAAAPPAPAPVAAPPLAEAASRPVLDAARSPAAAAGRPDVRPADAVDAAPAQRAPAAAPEVTEPDTHPVVRKDIKRVKGPRGRVRVSSEQVDDDVPMYHVYDERGGKQPLFSTTDRKDAVTWAHNHVAEVGTRKHPYDGGFMYAREDGVGELDSRLAPAGDELRFEPLARQWRKATGDRTPVEGGEGWQRLQREAAQAERARRGEPDQRQVPTERIAKRAPAAPAGQDTPQLMVSGRAGRVDVAPLPGGTPKKLPDMILDVSKALGKRVWVSKPAPGAGGTYFPGSARTVIRFAGDLDTTAHELAHALDDHYGIVGRWIGEPASPFDAELEFFWDSPASSATSSGPRSSPGYRRSEGVAEWVRAWLVNPTEAQRRAPQFAQYFEGLLPERAIGALRGFSDDIRRFAGMSATARTQANIRDPGDSGPSRVQQLLQPLRERGFAFSTTWLGKLRSQVQDALYPVIAGIRAGREMRGVEQLLPSKDPEVLLRLLGGINDKVGDIYDNGMVRANWTSAEDMRAEGIGGGVDWLIGWADQTSREAFEQDLKRLAAYMVAQRVLERGSHIDDQVDQIVAKLVDRAQLIRSREMKRVEQLAKAMRGRARVRAGQADRAINRTQGAQRLADEQGGKNDEDLAKVADEMEQRQRARLERMLKRLQARAVGAEKRKIDERIAKLRERFDRRRRKLDASLEQAIAAAWKARTFAVEDTEREISRLESVVEGRFMSQLGRIAAKEQKLRAAAKGQKGRLAGIGGGIFADDTQAAEVLAEVGADQQLRERLDEGAKRYRTWADATLRYMVDKGRLDEDAYRTITSRNEQYVAMHRAEDGEDLNAAYGSKGTGRRVGSVGAPVKKFKGGTRLIENPYVNLLRQTYDMVKEADRNQVLASFVDLLDSRRGMYQGKPEDLATIGSRAREGDENAFRVFRRQVVEDPETGEERTVVAEEYWLFEPGVAAALKDWGDVDDPNIIDQALRVPRHLLQKGVVLSPPFIVRNVFRDSINRAVISESGSGMLDPLKGYSVDEYQKFRSSGGGQAGHYMTDKPSFHRELRERIVELTKDRSTLLAMPGRLWNAYTAVAQGSETLSRMAEFKAAFAKAKQRGLNDYEASLEAAAKARGLIDYAVAGRAIRWANRYIPFLNPAVQGIWRSASGFWSNPATFGARWSAYVLAPTLAVYALNALRGPEDEEEYRNLPAWRRDLFWNIKVADDLWLSIPKPFELGALASGVERLVDMAREVQGGKTVAEARRVAFAGYGGSLAKAAIPVDDATILGPLKPFVELVTNYDTFSDRPIVSAAEQDLPVAMREGTKKASRIGKLGQAITGVDARQLDHLVRGLLGSSGTMALNASNLGREDRPGAAHFLSHASGILTNTPARGGRDIELFLDEERQAGRPHSKPAQRLEQLLNIYYSAGSREERTQAARAARAYARGEDPLRDFDRLYAELQDVETKRDQLMAMAKKTGAQADLDAMRAFAAAHRDQLQRAMRATRFARVIANIEQLRGRQGVTSTEREALATRQRDVASRAIAALVPQGSSK